MSAKRFKRGSDLRADRNFREEVGAVSEDDVPTDEISAEPNQQDGRELIPRPDAGGAGYVALPVVCSSKLP